MKHINLYSANGKTTVALPTPKGKGRLEIPAEDTGYHMRYTFAVLNDLINLFRRAGICQSDYWDCVKSELGITSRTEIAETVWALLSAEMEACRQDPAAFDRLASRVKAHLAETATEDTPLEDATPLAFADPDESLSTCFVLRKDRRTSEESLVYIGEFSESVRDQAQADANESRCIVRLYKDGLPPEAFHPETRGTCPF